MSNWCPQMEYSAFHLTQQLRYTAANKWRWMLDHTHGGSTDRRDQAKTQKCLKKKSAAALNAWKLNSELVLSAHQRTHLHQFQRKTTPTWRHHMCDGLFLLIGIIPWCVWCVCAELSVQTECVRACCTACRWCSTPPPAGSWTGTKWRPTITCFTLSVTHLRYPSTLHVCVCVFFKLEVCSATCR